MLIIITQYVAKSGRATGPQFHIIHSFIHSFIHSLALFTFGKTILII